MKRIRIAHRRKPLVFDYERDLIRYKKLSERMAAKEDRIFIDAFREPELTSKAKNDLTPE